MSKHLENKFNRLVEKSDPKKLQDKVVKYSNEAIDDVLLNGNKNDGLERMKISVKFIEDYTLNHPKNFHIASYKIIGHLLLTLSENYRES